MSTPHIVNRDALRCSVTAELYSYLARIVAEYRLTPEETCDVVETVRAFYAAGGGRPTDRLTPEETCKMLELAAATYAVRGGRPADARQ